MHRNYNKQSQILSLLQILEIKDGNRLIGKLLYDTTNDKIVFKNKIGLESNLVTEQMLQNDNKYDINNVINIEQKNENYVKYYGLWSKDITYSINSMVKYKNKFYLATEENINSKPSKLTQWDMLVYDVKPNNKEVAKFSINNTVREIDTIKKETVPIGFILQNNIPDFLDSIKNDIYINKSGNYQIIYNVAFASPITYCQIVLFTKIKENLVINNLGTACLSKSDTTHMVNINHSFVLNVDAEQQQLNTIDTTIDTEFDNNRYQYDTSVKLTFIMRFNNNDLGTELKIYSENSWLTIYEI